MCSTLVTFVRHRVECTMRFLILLAQVFIPHHGLEKFVLSLLFIVSLTVNYHSRKLVSSPSLLRVMRSHFLRHRAQFLFLPRERLTVLQASKAGLDVCCAPFAARGQIARRG